MKFIDFFDVTKDDFFSILKDLVNGLISDSGSKLYQIRLNANLEVANISSFRLK